MDGAETKVGGDTVVLDGPEGLLLRKFECKNGRIILWQKWEPEVLKPLCMRIHHEGSAHPGASRMLETVKLRLYWPAMRQETAAHCHDCRGCGLRNSYLRRPKVLVQ